MHEYLGLEGGPPNFRQDFTCPALLEDHGSHYAYGAITRYGHTFQSVLLVESVTIAGDSPVCESNQQGLE